MKIIKLKIKKVMFWISSNSNITLTHNLHACQWLATSRLFSAGTPVSSNKIDRHDITDLLLKVALNSITLILSL